MRTPRRFFPVSERLHARRKVWLPAAATLLFALLYLPLASMLVHATAPQTTVSAAPTAPVTAPSAPVTAVAPTPASKAAPSFPNCTPLAFAKPAELDLSSTASTLVVQNDPATTYQIYGNTASELRAQIDRCAPGADGTTDTEFTGQTDYALTWQYDVTADGTCGVSNAKVGLHIATALSLWQPTGNQTAGLANRWQTFSAALATHETGHAAIDRLYAAQLLTDLQSIHGVDCAALTDVVNTTANRDVQALNQANDTYDAQTNHGATQGAVLPSH